MPGLPGGRGKMPADRSLPRESHGACRNGDYVRVRERRHALRETLQESAAMGPQWPKVGSLPIARPGLSVAQPKILQEVITLSAFVPFAVLYLEEPLKLDYLWAGLYMRAAACFFHRSRRSGG